MSTISFTKTLACIFGLVAVISISAVSAGECPTFNFVTKTPELIYRRTRVCSGQTMQPIAATDAAFITASINSVINYNNQVTVVLPGHFGDPDKRCRGEPMGQSIPIEEKGYHAVHKISYEVDASSVPERGWGADNYILTAVTASFQGCDQVVRLTINVDVKEIKC
ncbi:hypothetical protein HDU97_005110 [Phlyctochytrium planicorne]|nr:hypothetical protein HDU97_005110 [Phlyctochytrium planicorne]